MELKLIAGRIGRRFIHILLKFGNDVGWINASMSNQHLKQNDLAGSQAFNPVLVDLDRLIKVFYGLLQFVENSGKAVEKFLFQLYMPLWF